ncbi:hypothetical protein FRC17_002432, partial [Serendipita sp. 399]
MSDRRRSLPRTIRSALATASHWVLATTSPTRVGSPSRKGGKHQPNQSSVDKLDLSLDISIAGFKALEKAAEVVPVAGTALKATCGIMVSILQLIKRCKENREGWAMLAGIIKERNESILALLELYSKAPSEYPSAERQAQEYQRVLDEIATDIQMEIQKRPEAFQGLATYWSRIQAIGRKAVLANINAEKIASYQDRLRAITFDVIALTTNHTNKMVSDIKAILTEQPKRKATKAVLKPRPQIVEDFVGREDILTSMRNTHFDNNKPSFRRDGPTITVLTAMGGSGKTQIAVKFASMFEERFPGTPVFFLDASSEISLNSDLDRLVRSQTDEHDDALAWLANDLENWLLILDNADDSSLDLPQYFPRCAHGHVVITTRDATRKLLAPRSTHTINVLPIEDSITLLLSSSGSEDNEINQSFARGIAEELGRLPLALSHAAAYILINNCLGTFLETYGKNRNQFMKTRPHLPQNYPHSVERTIEMSFYLLPPQTQDMMLLFARLDARSIPRCIIERAAERRFLHIPQETRHSPSSETVKQAEILRNMFCPRGDWNVFDFDAMVEACLKYSLLQFSTTDGEKFYSMHPLVQHYLQSASGTMCDDSPGRLVVRILASAVTHGRRYEFFGFNRLLAPHIRQVHWEDVLEAGDFKGFGFVLVDVGDISGIGYLEQCLAMWRNLQGEDDEVTLDSMAYLSKSYWSFGQEEKALPLQKQLLQKQSDLHGPDHRDTLFTINNLANTYSSLGREEEALPLREALLKRRQKLLDPDHLDILTAMSNLGLTYGSLGREEEALPLKEYVLEKRRTVLGPDHLDTLGAMNSLALTYSSLGREKEALLLQEEVLQKRKKLLGPDHLHTLMAMYNLASTYRLIGRAADSLLLYKEVLHKRTHLLGPEHRQTLLVINGLLLVFRQLGMTIELVAMAKKALPLLEK